MRCVQTSDQLIHDVTNISTDTDAIYKRLVSEPILTSVEGVRSSYLMSGTRNSDVTGYELKYIPYSKDIWYQIEMKSMRKHSNRTVDRVPVLLIFLCNLNVVGSA